MFKFLSTNPEIILIVSIVIILIVSIFLMIYLSKKNKIEEVSRDISFFKIETEDKETKEQEAADQLELENVLNKMKEDLEDKSAEVVRTFEEEQEEKSIISYQELLRANKKEVVDEVVEKTKEIKKEKFKNTEFISPVYGRVDKEENYSFDDDGEVKVQVQFDYTELDVNYDHLTSPIGEKDYGFAKSIIDLEQTINTHNLRQEMLENEKFLNALKEFRKNLE